MARARSRILLLVLAVAAIGLGAPSGAQGKECGREVIDQYFSTGRIGYHAQSCYASALRQIDPDARMYSGIVAAIRAARTRDKAADRRRAAEEAAAEESGGSGGGSADGGGGGGVVEPSTVEDPGLVEPAVEAVPPGEEVAPLLPPEDDRLLQSVRALELQPGTTTEQALTSSPATATEHVPLPVVLLGSLAVLLTLVGVGGLAVRWLDRTA